MKQPICYCGTPFIADFPRQEWCPPCQMKSSEARRATKAAARRKEAGE